MANSAKVLGAGDVRRLISYVRRGRYGDRDHVMVLLSFKAGLRAGEIAGLDWEMVVSADGQIGRHVRVASQIAKSGRTRQVPLNRELAAALRRLHQLRGCPSTGPVVRSERGGHMTPGAVVNWFGACFAELRLHGCSSHSGRRTFITRAARLLPKAGGSLRDVQILAGHASIITTQRYIDGDSDAQRKLVRLL